MESRFYSQQNIWFSMAVIKEKPKFNSSKPVEEKYGGYILPFDHFNNLTVYSRIWKNLPQDRYDYMCGKIVLQTEGLQQRMNTTTCSDILAGVNLTAGKVRVFRGLIGKEKYKILYRSIWTSIHKLKSNCRVLMHIDLSIDSRRILCVQKLL